MAETSLTKEIIESLGFKVTAEYEEPCYKMGNFLLIPFGGSWQLASDYGEPASSMTVVNTKEQLMASMKEK